MIASLGVAIIAILLLAAAMNRPGGKLGLISRCFDQRTLRIGGVSGLGLSFALAMIGGDPARHLVCWVMAVGWAALIVAFASR